MAVIRIVDDWLRSPVAPPSHYRSVMVIAEKWAEQRVLMRAYADSRDQLRPTITLHGVELAVGPAGLDVNGSWGIHISDPDGNQPQLVKEQLEGAARRIAGSKGNPPRLSDEESQFEREPTANWGPGAPRVLPKRPDVRGHVPVVDPYSAPGAARVPQQQFATYVPQQQQASHRGPGSAQSSTGMRAQSARVHADESTTEVRRRRARTKTQQPALGNPARTALGYQSGAGAQSAIVRLGLTPQISARLGRLVDKVVPADFTLTSWERRVLNTLGEQGEVTARAIGQLLDLADAVAFMDELVNKLEAYNLDLIEPGDAQGGEPAYRLRR